MIEFAHTCVSSLLWAVWQNRVSQRLGHGITPPLESIARVGHLPHSFCQLTNLSIVLRTHACIAVYSQAPAPAKVAGYRMLWTILDMASFVLLHCERCIESMSLCGLH